MTSILIVDDERDIRELIGDILRDEGFAVRLAANADECLAEINAEAQRVKALVEIFGRETPVELSFSQIQRV